jgi:hypothetical protein
VDWIVTKSALPVVVSNFITNPIFVSGTMENAVSLVELINDNRGKDESSDSSILIGGAK